MTVASIAANGGIKSYGFDSIILLTSTEEAVTLARFLRIYNAGLAIRPAGSLQELQDIPTRTLARSRLISFTTSVVVPGALLDRLGFGAYNFHPGPPTYPGWAPVHFACYDRATQFGVTAHVMIERVDAGPIIALDPFSISRSMSVKAVETLAYTRLVRLFQRLAKDLATRAEPFRALPARWHGCKGTHRRLAALCEMSPDVTREEVEHRIAVFGAGDFGHKLCINVHGDRFEFVGRNDATAAGEPRVGGLIGDTRRAINVHGYRFELVGGDEATQAPAGPRTVTPSGLIRHAPRTGPRRSPTRATAAVAFRP